MKTTFPTNVTDMLGRRDYDSFISDKLGNDLFISDPDRADRIWKASEDGADGSTHAEHIEDWREFAKIIYGEERRRINKAESDEEADAIEAEIENAYDALIADIDRVEAWHEKNGSLHEQIG